MTVGETRRVTRTLHAEDARRPGHGASPTLASATLVCDLTQRRVIDLGMVCSTGCRAC